MRQERTGALPVLTGSEYGGTSYRLRGRAGYFLLLVQSIPVGEKCVTASLGCMAHTVSDP